MYPTAWIGKQLRVDHTFRFTSAFFKHRHKSVKTMQKCRIGTKKLDRDNEIIREIKNKIYIEIRKNKFGTARKRLR